MDRGGTDYQYLKCNTSVALNARVRTHARDTNARDAKIFRRNLGGATKWRGRLGGGKKIFFFNRI